MFPAPAEHARGGPGHQARGAEQGQEVPGGRHCPQGRRALPSLLRRRRQNIAGQRNQEQEQGHRQEQEQGHGQEQGQDSFSAVHSTVHSVSKEGKEGKEGKEARWSWPFGVLLCMGGSSVVFTWRQESMQPLASENLTRTCGAALVSWC